MLLSINFLQFAGISIITLPIVPRAILIPSCPISPLLISINNFCTKNIYINILILGLKP